MIKVKKSRKTRIRQGDIFKEIEFIEYVAEKNGIIELSKITFPLVIVLTQDCDLDQDNKFRNDENKTDDKLLLSILVAPIYNIEHVFLGEHLSDLDLTMEPIKRTKSPGKYLLQNERPRYHYIQFPDTVDIVPSAIDFKHYFSVNLKYLLEVRKKSFVCSVSEIYREDILLRFSNYLSRIGLP